MNNVTIPELTLYLIKIEYEQYFSQSRDYKLCSYTFNILSPNERKAVDWALNSIKDKNRRNYVVRNSSSKPLDAIVYK